MTWWQAVVLGLVQGITEFLPVSSDGHLVLAAWLTGAQAPGVWFEVMLHLATLGAVLAVFGKRLWTIALGVLRGRPEDLRYAVLLALATLPAVVLVLVAGDALEQTFDSLLAAGIGFLITGTVLWTSRHRGGTATVPTWPVALLIGVGQALAILPGVSRSGLTVAVALWAGMGPLAAGEFSFLMAVPAIAGAGLFELLDAGGAPAGLGLGILALGLVVAFAAGVWAIRFLLVVLDRNRFYAFAPYCWAVGAVTLALALWRG